MRSHAFGCGCFLKVYVCPQHISMADAQIRVELEGLRDQLQLAILDRVGSVSAPEAGGPNGEYQSK